MLMLSCYISSRERDYFGDISESDCEEDEHVQSSEELEKMSNLSISLTTVSSLSQW